MKVIGSSKLDSPKGSYAWTTWKRSMIKWLIPQAFCEIVWSWTKAPVTASPICSCNNKPIGIFGWGSHVHSDGQQFPKLIEYPHFCLSENFQPRSAPVWSLPIPLLIRPGAPGLLQVLLTGPWVLLHRERGPWCPRCCSYFVLAKMVKVGNTHKCTRVQSSFCNTPPCDPHPWTYGKRSTAKAMETAIPEANSCFHKEKETSLLFLQWGGTLLLEMLLRKTEITPWWQLYRRPLG